MNFLLPFTLTFTFTAAAGGGGYYAPPLDTVEVVADRAEVTLAGMVLSTVEKGRRFGVRERKGDLVGIQFLDKKNLRRGWLRPTDVKLLTDDNVDLATEALKIAKQFNPKVDVAACRARVDELATRVADAARGAASPRQKALAISIQLFRQEGFRYEITPCTFDTVLETKVGNCLGLSLLYLCAAEKLKMPFRLLAVPRHVLIHYDDGEAGREHPRVPARKEQFNVEPSIGGWVFVDDTYMRRMYGPPGGINWSVLSKPQALAVLQTDVGYLLAAKKDYAAAADRFGRACEINPNFGQAYYNWGNALTYTKQLARACEKFARATQIHPYYADAYNNWGNALGHMGEMESACRKYAAAVECAPRSAKAHFNWGIALLHMGKRNEAVEKFARAIELAPTLKPMVDEAIGNRPTSPLQDW